MSNKASFLGAHPNGVHSPHLCRLARVAPGETARYASLAPLYYRGAAAAVVAYDITSPDTFRKAKFWVKELQKHGGPGMVMALVGNKVDLAEAREVSEEEAREYADANGMFFIETSAKTADNVNELFEQIATRIPRSAAPAGPA